MMALWGVALGLALSPPAASEGAPRGEGPRPEARRTGLDAEPTVEEVLAALIPLDRAPVDDALARSRWAAALPQRLSVRVRRDESLALDDSSSDDGWSTKSRDASRLAWEVHAQWSLSELALNRDTARLLALREGVERREAARREALIHAYFQRRRAQLLFLSTADPVRRAALWSDVGELTARLDDATGGLFRRAAVRWWEP